jgi:hypothetical protein
LLSSSELKTWLHRDLPQLEKLLLILGTFDEPCQVKDIRERAKEAGFRTPGNWNPSATLGRSRGLAIRAPKGWEITDAGKQHLRNVGVTKISPSAVQVATDLRAELPNVNSESARAFIKEVIRCYELELYRSAIVMSGWQLSTSFTRTCTRTTLARSMMRRSEWTLGGRTRRVGTTLAEWVKLTSSTG